MEAVLPSIILVTSAAIADWSPAEVEAAYWDCESAAVQGAISPDVAAGCSEVYERLKKEKFRDSYDHFLVWWKREKDRELSSRIKQR